MRSNDGERANRERWVQGYGPVARCVICALWFARGAAHHRYCDPCWYGHRIYRYVDTGVAP